MPLDISAAGEQLALKLLTWGGTTALTFISRKVLNRYLTSAASGIVRVLAAVSVGVAAVATWWLLRLPSLEVLAIGAAAIFVISMLYELVQFWRVGLQVADVTVKRGLSYRRSLEICHNEMWLLGTGGHKLTSEDAFVPAVRRCSRFGATRVRFLLARPDSEFLLSAARRARKPATEYQQNVRTSLARLAELRELGIQVRFYQGAAIPLFRLMFIDDRLCLLSYNHFGEGDGSQRPQLRVAKQSVRKRDVDSFYYPFRNYFESLWETAEEWDFRQYLPEPKL
jgi:hypothetical protein